jgi:hypothetical protein
MRMPNALQWPMPAIVVPTITLYATVPNSGNRLIFMIEQGTTAIVAFDALHRTIDSIAKL